MKENKTFYESIVELRKNKKIPKQWRVHDIRPFFQNKFSLNTINVYPNNCSVSLDGKTKGDYVKKGQSPKFYRLGKGTFELIDENILPVSYGDIVKAHSIFKGVEKRWIFYDVYLKNRDSSVWFKSKDLPIREGILLFGFIQSWDPNFQGDLNKFIKIYKDIFPLIKEFELMSIETTQFDSSTVKTIKRIFENIAHCPLKNRRESTDASKILHVMLPKFFVMWDTKIRKGIFGDNIKNGERYAKYFLPEMQRLVKGIVDDYAVIKRCDLELAAEQISKELDNYTLAKLIDEYNYVKYTKKQNI